MLCASWCRSGTVQPSPRHFLSILRLRLMADLLDWGLALYSPSHSKPPSVKYPSAHTTSRFVPATQEYLSTVCTGTCNYKFTAWNNQINHACVPKEAIWKFWSLVYPLTVPLDIHACQDTASPLEWQPSSGRKPSPDLWSLTAKI